MTDNEKKLGNDALDVLAKIVTDEMMPKVMLIREMINTTDLKDGWVVSIIGEPLSSDILISAIIGETSLTAAEAAHAQGNWFATEKEVIKESKRRIVMQKLRGFAVPWEGKKGPPYINTLYYRHSIKKWTYSPDEGIQRPNTLYFTEEGAQAALKSLGEELDILL